MIGSGSAMFLRLSSGLRSMLYAGGRLWQVRSFFKPGFGAKDFLPRPREHNHGFFPREPFLPLQAAEAPGRGANESPCRYGNARWPTATEHALTTLALLHTTLKSAPRRFRIVPPPEDASGVRFALEGVASGPFGFENFIGNSGRIDVRGPGFQRGPLLVEPPECFDVLLQ